MQLSLNTEAVTLNERTTVLTRL